jgi:hypothetical protein
MGTHGPAWAHRGALCGLAAGACRFGELGSLHGVLEAKPDLAANVRKPDAGIGYGI